MKDFYKNRKLVYELSKARMKAEIIIYLLLKIKENRELQVKEKAKLGYAVMQRGVCTFRLNQIKKAIENKSLETSSIA